LVDDAWNVGTPTDETALRSSSCPSALADLIEMLGVQMDEDLFLKGLAQRKATLGDEYVQKSLEGADEFTRPFQQAMTAWCWGFGWGDDAIDPKTRSMMNLAMIGALGKMQEWELHCQGALRNGVSKEEIRAIVHVIAIYCGVPQGLECFRAARKVLEAAGEI
jgi:4-carboxymuconolactone decarboxylase